MSKWLAGNETMKDVDHFMASKTCYGLLYITQGMGKEKIEAARYFTRMNIFCFEH